MIATAPQWIVPELRWIAPVWVRRLRNCATDTGTQAKADVTALWRFVGRTDVYSVQKVNGDHRAVYKPLTPEVLEQHLAGETIGAYPADGDATCRVGCLDFDLGPRGTTILREDVEPKAREIHARIAKALESLGLDPQAFVMESSGQRGLHGWMFFDPATPQAAAFHFMRLLGSLTGAGESFPKQAGKTRKGLGNPVKLPLGVHRQSGQRSCLLGPDGTPDTRPLGVILADVPALSPETIMRADYLPLPRVGTERDEKPAGEDWLVGWVLEALRGVKQGDGRGRQRTANRLAGYFLAKGLSPAHIWEIVLLWKAARTDPPLSDDEALRAYANALRDWRRQRTETLPGLEKSKLEFRVSPVGRSCTHGGRSTYEALMVVEWKRGLPSGSWLDVSSREIEDCGGVGRRRVPRVLTRLADQGLIEYKPGRPFKKGQKSRAARMRRLLPLPGVDERA